MPLKKQLRLQGRGLSVCLRRKRQQLFYADFFPPKFPMPPPPDDICQAGDFLSFSKAAAAAGRLAEREIAQTGKK